MFFPRQFYPPQSLLAFGSFAFLVRDPAATLLLVLVFDCLALAPQFIRLPVERFALFLDFIRLPMKLSAFPFFCLGCCVRSMTLACGCVHKR